jgi:hypothetical protein
VKRLKDQHRRLTITQSTVLGLTPDRSSTIRQNEIEHHNAEALEEQAMKELKEDKKFCPLYFKYLAPYIKKAGMFAGDRNKCLINIVTFLFRAVGKKNVMPLAMLYFDLNQSKFSGATSRDEHMAEALAHLLNTESEWVNSLTDEEFSFVSKHKSANTIAAFRICRDLASQESPDYPPGFFYMAQGRLAKRLGSGNDTAYLALNTLQRAGIIRVTKKGMQYSKDKRDCNATDFAWINASKVTDEDSSKSKQYFIGKPR